MRLLSGFHFHRVVTLAPFLISLAAGLGIEALGDRWRIDVNQSRRALDHFGRSDGDVCGCHLSGRCLRQGEWRSI